MSLPVLAPLTGTVLALGDVPDPVFSGAMVGPGIAVDPGAAETVDVLAPVAGTVTKLHPHAFVLLGDGGRGLLVHLGLDTVQLGGAGFTLHVAERDVVAAGQRLATWSPRQVLESGRSPVTPVIALEARADALDFAAAPGAAITAGDLLLRWA
ncbi:MAG: PTS sugar transporter subunit IIA [Georgenia sp.]